MKFDNINISGHKRRVLVAPLDWGLGHATRCIPIIYELLSLQIEVIIAADGAIKNLLKKEFPDVVFTQLKGYEIRYSSTMRGFAVGILLQFPKLLRAVYNEHWQLKKIIEKYKIDAVISDNRLGLYHATIPCIYITHQLQIKTHYRLTDWLAQQLHYFFINKYAACWVPDNAAANNLAGTLSHPVKMPATTVEYLGPLSRFKKITCQKKYDLLLLLSGPEPQRSLFENKLLAAINAYPGSVLVVRGLPGITANEETALPATGKITVVDHLPATALNKAIQEAKLIICRSGYTTIMDLVQLQQKAILVPTPGQTEQEYLARYLQAKQLFYSVPQHHFSLHDDMEKAAVFSYSDFPVSTDAYKKAVEELVKKISGH